MEILRPLLAETGAERMGTVVIGTVKGDIHDIGKNLVAMMLEGAGFDVVDLGINNPVENYLAAIEEHEPDIVGMSALLTTTMPYMKVVIDELVDKGLRDQVHRAGGRRTPERGVRQGGRRRRLLPRRRRRGRDRPGARAGPPGDGAVPEPMAELTVIRWRDIPMQVVARGAGGAAARALLDERFQEAVDAAAMVAGLIGSDDYTDQMRMERRGCGDDLDAEVADELARIEAEWTHDVLRDDDPRRAGSGAGAPA